MSSTPQGGDAPKPETLEQAVAHLVMQLPDAEKLRAEGMTEDGFIGVAHHGFGTGLRNGWGLWKEDSPLHQHFRKLGLWHADDMSGTIMTCFYRELKGLPWEVESQVQHYKDFWLKQGLGDGGVKL